MVAFSSCIAAVVRDDRETKMGKVSSLFATFRQGKITNNAKLIISVQMLFIFRIKVNILIVYGVYTILLRLELCGFFLCPSSNFTKT